MAFWRSAFTMGALTSGCTLFTSLGGLSGDPGPLADASADAGASDAPAEANDAADASGPFCQTLSPAPRLCADFEDGVLTGFFDVVRSEPPARVVELEPQPNGSLSVRAVVGEGAGGCAYADLRLTEKRTIRELHVSFALRNGDRDGGAVGSEFQRVLRVDPCGIMLEANAADAHVQTSDGSFSLGKPIVPGVWTRVGLDLIATDDGKTTLDVTLDGQPARVRATLATCDIASWTEYSLSVGFFCTPVSDPRELAFDDVVLDTR